MEERKKIQGQKDMNYSFKWKWIASHDPDMVTWLSGQLCYLIMEVFLLWVLISSSIPTSGFLKGIFWRGQSEGQTSDTRDPVRNRRTCYWPAHTVIPHQKLSLERVSDLWPFNWLFTHSTWLISCWTWKSGPFRINERTLSCKSMNTAQSHSSVLPLRFFHKIKKFSRT